MSVLELTRRCNLKCQHCYAVTTDTTSDMLSHAEGLRLIDDLAEFGMTPPALEGATANQSAYMRATFNGPEEAQNFSWTA